MESFPTLTYHGALSANEVYTKENVLDIVNFAAKLGIRVIPEFDNPGHTRAIGMDPNFADIVRCFTKDNNVNIERAYTVKGDRTGVLDPTLEKTYDLLDGVFTELDSLF